MSINRLLLLVFTLLATGAGIAADNQPVVISADAWVTGDFRRRVLVVHQPPPAAPIEFRMPKTAYKADLNIDAGVLCVRDDSSMWSVDLRSQQLVRVALPLDLLSMRTTVVGSRSGACATPVADTEIRVLKKSGEVATVRLVLPPGMTEFRWQGLGYDDTHQTYFATGQTTFALVPDGEMPATVNVRKVVGKVAKGSIEDTHFSRFMCCSRLSADGRTLFSMARLGYGYMSAVDGLAAIDIRSASYRRMYLPFSPNWHATGRGYGSLLEGDLWITVNEGGMLWLTGKGDTLVFNGGVTPERENGPQVFGVHIQSGLANPVPQQRSMKDMYIKGISQSGKYWLWDKMGLDGPTRVSDNSGKMLVQINDGVLAIAHAQRSDSVVQLEPAGSQPVRRYQSTFLADEGVKIPDWQQFNKWLKHATNLHQLRKMLIQVQASKISPKTGETVSFNYSELIVHAQNLPLPVPDRPFPLLNDSVGDDAQAWQQFMQACNRYAEEQQPAYELALLQCTVSPW